MVIEIDPIQMYVRLYFYPVDGQYIRGVLWVYVKSKNGKIN